MSDIASMLEQERSRREEQRLRALPYREQLVERDRLRREVWAELDRLHRCPCGAALLDVPGPTDWVYDAPARVHKRYCSAKCRQKAYRDRKRVTAEATLTPPVTPEDAQ
jgi:hypothetical protein